MALYDRSFNVGRGSEQLYNEEMHRLYELMKNLPYDVVNPDSPVEPESRLDGALWHDWENHFLKWWDKSAGKYRPFYENYFRLVSEMMSALPPENPLYGQLWIHNGVLCYFDGTTWQPIQALEASSSQFSLDVFKNFMIASPLWTLGNGIVAAEDIAAFRAAMKQYLQGVIDAKSHDSVAPLKDEDVSELGKKWKIGDTMEISDPLIPTFDDNTKAQLLVPHINYARLFLDHELDVEKYDPISTVCVQYKVNDLLNTTPSLVHLNPGRVIKMTKRLVKIDRDNPKIMISAADTEYYGFKAGSWGGEFLRPDAVTYDNNSKTKCDICGLDHADMTNAIQDYLTIPGGILLEFDAAQNYDYVLAVHYDFSWIKSSGTMTRINTSDSLNSYYINGYNGPMNVFVEGYDIEEPYFESDGLSSTITFKENVKGLEVSAMHSPEREYGYIRAIDVFNRGVVHPLREYHTPLIFVNGEALSISMDDIEIDSSNQRYLVPGATRDMAWSVVELYDAKEDFNAFYSEGNISLKDASDNYYVEYDPTEIPDDDSVVLFIDGLLVKKEDLNFDRTNGRVYAPGLALDQEYILLHDKYGWLYDEASLVPALAAKKISDSLVYFNNKLLCNDLAIDTQAREVDLEPAHNEIKCFKNIYYVANPDNPDLSETVVTREYKVYDERTKTWNLLTQPEIDDLITFAYGYENTRRSIKLLLPYTNDDDIIVYAFGFANDVENPLVIRNIDINEPTGVTEIDVEGGFDSGKNMLRVWLNGIRMYPEAGDVKGIKEKSDGSGFILPEPIYEGKLTYILETNASPITSEILGPENIQDGSINIYKTKLPMYPGRTTIYVNGIRQAKDSYIIQDNYTLIFTGDTKLIGNYTNYPTETIVTGTTEITLDRPVPDYVLVEVRQDDRVEKSFQLEGPHPVYELDVDKYNLEREILETNDEILIFVDGLFYGAKAQDGYICNMSRTSIVVTQPEMLSAMNHDEEFVKLTTEEKELLAYKEKYDKEYEQYNPTITLEWRP